MPISTAFKLLQKMATKQQISSCPTFFFLLYFSCLLYIVVVWIVIVLVIQELGSDIHRYVYILALGSFSHIGYYGVLSRIPCATKYAFSDYLLDIY